MVALTWAIVATAYFGVIDYRSLVGEFLLLFSTSCTDLSVQLGAIRVVACFSL